MRLHLVPDTPTVLVVEDEPDIMLILRLWLMAAGYEVIEAANGREALRQAAMHDPTVVVLDLRLPDMDGWSVLKELRSDERTRSLPIVIASAHAWGSTARSAADQGCGFVTKPFTPEIILAAVAGQLGRRRTGLARASR